MKPAPPYFPNHGGQYVPNNPGNPFWPGPNLVNQTGVNPGGMLPGQVVGRGLERWTGVQGQQFKNVADENQVWLWQSPLLDLRPGAAQATGSPVDAVPVNHEAALGLGVYLNVLIASRNGANAPAAIPFMTVTAWEQGNNLSSADTYMLSQKQDITEQVQSGGTNGFKPYGASPLSFTPSCTGWHFWQVCIEFTIPGAVPIGYDLFIQAATN
jgi:hypothetical protein